MKLVKQAEVLFADWVKVRRSDLAREFVFRMLGRER